MDINTLSAFAGIIAVFCGGFNFIVIKPLKSSIESLQKSIDKLAAGLEDIKERHNNLKVQVTELEARCKSNQHRIDRLEELTDRRNDNAI